MKNLQIIGQSLERWTSTCGLSFSLIDESGTALCQTGGSALPEKEFAERFWNAEEDQAAAAGTALFHIKEDGETIGLLAVSGPEDQADVIGPLAVCQVESLLSAASGRNDRTQFLQDALLGHLTDRELDRQAHKAHIQTAAPRVVLLIETSQPMDTGIHSIIRTVMGKLYNLKQIAGDTGHQNAGPVAVKEREGQRLHVRKHIATHIRLHQRSHAVPDDGDEILKPGPQQIGGKENCHHGKERGKLLLRQQAVHRVPRHIGEGQIHQRHRQRQAHIECESGSMRVDIGSKDREL